MEHGCLFIAVEYFSEVPDAVGYVDSMWDELGEHTWNFFWLLSSSHVLLW